MVIKRIFDIAAYALEKFPQEDMFATKYQGTWEKMSTQELINMGNQFSRGLLKLGIQPGDKIVLITSASRNEWAVVDLSVLQIGAVVVPVYPNMSSTDYEYIFNNAEAKYCIISDVSLLEKVNKIKDNVPTLQGIFSFDEIEGIANWREILDLGEDPATQTEVDDLARAINPEDLATLIYTSGTTGKPKGVMLSHENIVSNILACDERVPILKTIPYQESRALSFLPICHILERTLVYIYQFKGFSVYFAESIEKMGENIQEVKPHYITVVPRVIEKVYARIYNAGVTSGGIKSKIFYWALNLIEKKKGISKPKGLFQWIADKLVFKKWREALGGNICTLVSGSASLSYKLNHLFQNAGIPIMEGYGLTETSPVISVNSFEHMKVGTVGPVLKNLDVKIQEDGEITVKGPSVFKSYYKNEELTKEAFTEDGYFKTGDIGHINEDGFLIITDRKKEMFKTSGGKYIAPQLIENMAKSSKFIEQIMVVGEGEKMPCAIIQPDFYFAAKWAEYKHIDLPKTSEGMAESPILKKRIEKDIEKLNATLGHWEKIKKIELTPTVWSVEGGELTPTLKMKRKFIKEKYKSLYNKLYDKE